MVCGLLLAIKEADVLKPRNTKTDHKICVFDVILRSIFFKHRIDYAVVLRHCIDLGYCTPAFEDKEDRVEQGCASTKIST